MRVIAGTARRLNLVTPKGFSTRPTSDKVKETLFNILQPHLYGVRFLDLFAGSGGIGIEALSRGAREAVFIEKDKEALNCINKNIATTHFEEKAVVIASDVFSGLYNITSKEPFDIIFMDPPYNTGLEEQVLNVLKNAYYVSEDTLIVVEADVNTDFSYVDDLGFTITKIKEYKNNKHVFMYRSEK